MSGPLALLEMMRRPEFFRDFDMTMFPILNPDGLLKECAKTPGIDLNRDYRDPKSAEIASHVEALQTLGRFDGTIMLHEDLRRHRRLLFELNDEDCRPPRREDDCGDGATCAD